MHLKTFFFLITIVLGTLAFTAIGALLYATGSIRGNARVLGETVQSVYVAEELRTLLLTHSRDRLIRRLERSPRKLQSPHVEKNRWLKAIERHISNGEEQEVFNRVKRSVNSYLSEMERLDKRPSAAVPVYLRTSPLLDEALNALDDLVELNRRQADEARAGAVDKERWVWLGSLTLTLLLVSAIVIIIFSSKHLIYDPLIRLKAEIRDFKQGVVPGDGKRSLIVDLREIGEAFSEMAKSLVKNREAQLRFIGGVVHDIRNPLNAVKSALQLLSTQRLNPEKTIEFYAMAQRQINHLASLTKDLADTAQIEAGRFTLSMAEVELVDIIRDSTELFSETTKKHRFVTRGPQSCSVWADGKRLRQVLNNLISNAVKYSPDGGEVVIELRDGDSEVFISVTDHGIGIPLDEQASVFEPFKRTSRTESSFQGMGLGLSVVKKIVEAHGGEISLISNEGEGSTFMIRIPRARAADIAPAAELYH